VSLAILRAYPRSSNGYLLCEERALLNPSQFQQLCRARQFSAETVDLIARIRFSPPARRVQGHAGNVCGTYPSRKMGVTIQFESHTVELGAVYLMEHDEEVHLCVAVSCHPSRTHR